MYAGSNLTVLWENVDRCADGTCMYKALFPPLQKRGPGFKAMIQLWIFI